MDGVEALGSGASNKKNLFEQKAQESKQVKTAAGKQLDGIESVGASNKKNLFEQKAQEAKQVQTAAGKQLDGIDEEAARKKKELYVDLLRFFFFFLS